MRRTPQQWLTLFETQRKIQGESHLLVKQFCFEQGIYQRLTFTNIKQQSHLQHQ
jgi:hypothetical protein